MTSLGNKILISGDDVTIVPSAKQYKQTLLSLIDSACERIYITALYVQDDEAGREILHALYKAKKAHPDLDVKIFVDYHRGQRGLIGEKESMGNRALYLELAKHYEQKIDVYGVAVKNKELFGVLHLKGMVFDNDVFYTGASINDIYMHQSEKYRLDRYYQIRSESLANSFCHYLQSVFVDNGFAPLLNNREDNAQHNTLPSPAVQKRHIIALKAKLKKFKYQIDASVQQASCGHMITIKPLVGFGRRKNELNKAIRKVIQNSQQSILIFTPYFNLPPVLAKDVIKSLKRGVKITMVVGDKTANDFFINNDDAFSFIGIVPYIYEMLLQRFVKRYQQFIDSGLLTIRLWKHESNSFHLKGVIADDRFHLLTGSNLNPRAWGLDLENGLLIDDPSGILMPKVNDEIKDILQYTNVIKHYTEIESIQDYPEKPKNLLKKIKMTQIDRVLKRFL